MLCTRSDCNVVSYSGSVFKSELLLAEFTRLLKLENIKVIEPIYGADRGALLKALELKNKDCLLEEL